MKTVIIACDTLRDELLLVQSRTGNSAKIIWIEGNLHNFPDRLRKTLQEQLDQLTDCGRVLLAFGFCGNSIVGLKARDFELIFPRVDDCISLVLGGMDRRQQLGKAQNAFFLTRGWLGHTPNIVEEITDTLETYGEDVGGEIVGAMYAHYDAFTVVDTGAYDIPPVLAEAQKAAEALGLCHNLTPGTTDYLARLVNGPWDDDHFIRIGPNDEVSAPN